MDARHGTLTRRCLICLVRDVDQLRIRMHDEHYLAVTSIGKLARRGADCPEGLTPTLAAVAGQQDQPANLREKIVGPHVAPAQLQCVNDRVAALQNVGRPPPSVRSASAAIWSRRAME